MNLIIFLYKITADWSTATTANKKNLLKWNKEKNITLPFKPIVCLCPTALLISNFKNSVDTELLEGKKKDLVILYQQQF